MGKIFEQTITDFAGGMTNSIRSKDLRFSRIIKHCDPLTAKGKLIPFRDMATDSVGNTEKFCQYLVAVNAAGTAPNQYALGVVSGQTYAKIFRNTSGSGASWVAATTAEDSVARNENLFIEYKDVIYGANTSNIWSYAILTNTFTSAAQALTYTNIAQGLVHSKDDILYIPYDNKIASKNGGGAFNLTALTLPTNQIITAICEYGNYLAIAAKPKYAPGKSIVYLWDRDSSLTTLSEKIDFGSETLVFLEELDGYLIGISKMGGSGTDGVDYFGWIDESRVVFKFATSGMLGAKPFLRIDATSSGIQIAGKQKANNRLYFMMSIQINSVQYDGVWAVGRNEDGQYALYMDRALNNDTAITTPVLKGFLLFGDFLFVAYTTSGTYVANITINSGTYTSASGTYESLIIGDGRHKYKLHAIGCMTQPMPTAGQIILKYKVDAEASFTTIFTHTTDDAIYHEAINVESSGAELPQFRELQIQSLGTGKAVLTGLYLKYEQINDNPTD